jgi:antitoxin component YwqK of YwqJK toxin-antitoxin module
MFMCMICFEDGLGEEEIEKYCSDDRHVFCKTCFADWVKASSSKVLCPVCREVLFDSYPGWVRDGLGTTYSGTGEKRSECMYVKGVRHGVFREYFSPGFLWREETYEMGILEGPCRTWNEDDLLVAECFYHQGKKHGPSREWYSPSGQLKGESTYQDGVLHGPCSSYHECGQKSYETIYQNGFVDGISRHWYSCGTLWLESLFIDGHCIYGKKWNRQGILIEETLHTYREEAENPQDRRISVKRLWFPDGTPKSESRFNLSHKKGPYQEWKMREEGCGSYLWKKCCFERGFLHGPYQEFNESGEMMVDRVYKMGHIVPQA